MNEQKECIKVKLTCGVDYYKGEKPVKGVDYFTEEDIREIADYIENMDIVETDPTVPEWAKQPNKPTYTASEVGALPDDTYLFSGDYNDLRNKPDIPSYDTINDLQDGMGEIWDAIDNNLATKDYVDTEISKIPAPKTYNSGYGIEINGDVINVDSGVIASHDWVDEEIFTSVPSWAMQGVKPTYTAQEVGALPANTALFSGNYNDLTNKPTIPTVPTNVSAFTNDAGYLTSHQSLTDYATKDYVEQVVAGIETGALKRSVVQALPTEDIDSNTIYMVSRTNSETNNVYDEYLYVNNSWEKIGSTDVDLSDYATESYVDTAIANIPQSTTYTFTNGLAENNGTVSWTHNNRISGGSTASALRINDITDSAFAMGAYSLTVGRRGYAQGAYSFCEGDNNATYGEASHAEGYDTQAVGKYTHAEGWGTRTSATASHAEGKYNIQDSRFQNVAGNGSSDSNRSTMFARDWQGNEYLAGNLYVGCDDYSTTATNNGGSKVATESYVDSAIANIPSTTSSGATYTAGNGISIDSNNEISNINYPDFMWLILKESYADEIEAIKLCSTKQEVIDGLNAGRIVYIQNAIADVLNIGTNNTDLNNSYLGYFNLINYGTNEQSGYASSIAVPLAADTYLYAKKRYIFRWKKGNLTPRIQYNNNGTVTTLGNMFEEINTSLANKQDVIIPAVPSTDGNYKLTTSISSGTATTEWVADSGGSSYTAGDGISIDSNNVISKTPYLSSILGLLFAIEAGNTGIYNANTWINSFIPAGSIDNQTVREKHIHNLKTLGMTYLFNGLGSNGTYLKEIIQAVGGDDTTTNLPVIQASNVINDQYTIGMGLYSFSYSYMDMMGFMNKPVLIIFNGAESKGSNYRWYFIANPEKVFQNKYFNSVQGLTSHSIPQAIDEVASSVSSKFTAPTAPSTDGTYFLTTTISSGTATYSWENVVIGGSY